LWQKEKPAPARDRSFTPMRPSPGARIVGGVLLRSATGAVGRADLKTVTARQPSEKLTRSYLPAMREVGKSNAIVPMPDRRSTLDWRREFARRFGAPGASKGAARLQGSTWPLTPFSTFREAWTRRRAGIRASIQRAVPARPAETIAAADDRSIWCHRIAPFRH
jgi:hypothetical protein